MFDPTFHFVSPNKPAIVCKKIYIDIYAPTLIPITEQMWILYSVSKWWVSDLIHCIFKRQMHLNKTVITES